MAEFWKKSIGVTSCGKYTICIIQEETLQWSCLRHHPRCNNHYFQTINKAQSSPASLVAHNEGPNILNEAFRSL